MHVCSVASVDDGNWCHFGCIERGSLYVVTHGYDVGIVGYHEERVLEGFALCGACYFCIGKAYDACSETVGSGFEGQARAGAGFEE